MILVLSLEPSGCDVCCRLIYNSSQILTFTETVSRMRYTLTISFNSCQTDKDNNISNLVTIN